MNRGISTDEKRNLIIRFLKVLRSEVIYVHVETMADKYDVSQRDTTHVDHRFDIAEREILYKCI